MVRARLCVRPLFLAAEIILGQRYKLNPCFLALRRNIMFRSFKEKYHILYWIAEITDINYMFSPPPPFKLPLKCNCSYFAFLTMTKETRILA